MEIFNKNKNLLYWLMIALVSSLIVLSWTGINTPSTDKSMTFSAEAEIDIKPDTATLNIEIQERAKTQQEANNKATQKARSILTTLKSLNIEEKDIKTKEIISNNELDYTKQPYAVIGYISSQRLEIKIRDISKIESVKSQIIKIGANLGGLNWDVENMEFYEQQARQKAITNAKEKAKTISKDLDVKFGNIINFSENFDTNQNRVYMMATKAAATPGFDMQENSSIPEGVNKIKSTVHITFELK